jgi:hypothetical protein
MFKKGKNGNRFLSLRRFVVWREIRRTGRCAPAYHAINLQRSHHILQFHLPHPFQRLGDAIRDLVEDLLGNTNAARFGQWFDASGDIDPIANHVVITMDNIASMNSDTNLEIPLRWIDGISLRDHLLNFNPALHCRQGAGKFGQETISNCLDFRAPMFWKN